MEFPFKRTDWNDIIGDVNEVAQNPANDCPAEDTLPTVGECHIWTPDDITIVQDKINSFREIEYVFSTPNPGDKWWQTWVDEIEDALSEGWTKDCTEPPDEDCPCENPGNAPPGFPPRLEWPPAFCVTGTYIPDPSPEGGAPPGSQETFNVTVPATYITASGPSLRYVNAEYYSGGSPGIYFNFDPANNGDLRNGWGAIQVKNGGMTDFAQFTPDPAFDDLVNSGGGYNSFRDPITINIAWPNYGLQSNATYKDATLTDVTIVGCEG